MCVRVCVIQFVYEYFWFISIMEILHKMWPYHMWPIAAVVAWLVCLSVCMCLLDILLSYAKMAEPIGIPFGVGILFLKYIAFVFIPLSFFQY